MIKLSIAVIIAATAAFAEAEKFEDCALMRNKQMEMEIISSNIENVNTTRTPQGGPYKAKKLVCKEKMCAIISYQNTITKQLPGHPDANEIGEVRFPDIDIAAEMQSMIEAKNVYEQAARNCKSKSFL